MSKKDTAVQILSFLGVLFTLASLFISVSALVKDTWITGAYQVQTSYYQWKTCAVNLGFFSSCNSCNGCGGTFSWIPGAIDSELYSQWTTLQAFFMMHLFFAALSFAFMQSTAVKPCLVTVLKFAAPSAYVANFLTGMIAVTLSTTQIPRLGNYGSWNRDISINLQIASFAIAAAGLSFHAISRLIRARKNKTEVSSIDTPLLDGPAYQSIQEQPQQIAVVVNGQTVMATVNPTHPGTPVQVVPSGDAYNPAFGHPQQLMASWGQHSPAVFYQVQQPQL